MTVLLGGLSPAEFLRAHWQKKPLVVRQAIPGFRGLLTPEELARVAPKAGAGARTVTQKSGRYVVDEGPFGRVDLARAPRTNWTLLVQGIEQHVDGAWELLQRFSFIPSARVDDLMVSYAVPGGSVGPHDDAYDVFLLQGTGRRRWKIPDGEWVLEPGDMLYLPPRVTHFGVAVDACTTYSIGFSAPRHEQLVHNFLAFLAQEAQPGDGIYADPDLALQADPAALSDDAIAQVARVLARQLAFDDERVAIFFGRLLTGPKPGVKLHAPRRALDDAAFARALAAPGALTLARATRMLFRAHAGGVRVFVNGDAHDLDHDAAARSMRAVRTLANTRALALPVDVEPRGRALLHALYRRGFVALTPAPALPPRGS